MGKSLGPPCESYLASGARTGVARGPLSASTTRYTMEEPYWIPGYIMIYHIEPQYKRAISQRMGFWLLNLQTSTIPKSQESSIIIKNHPEIIQKSSNIIKNHPKVIQKSSTIHQNHQKPSRNHPKIIKNSPKSWKIMSNSQKSSKIINNYEFHPE